jgi:hypothetical protein
LNSILPILKVFLRTIYNSRKTMRKVYTLLSLFICFQVNAQICLRHIKSSTNGDASNTLSSPRKIISADFNTDGKADLAAIYNEFTSHVSVLLGDGTGAFKSEIKLASNDSINDIITADYNNDGKADIAIVATNNYIFEITVFLGNGDGTFESGKTSQIVSTFYAAQMYSIINADFNSDGKIDIATASYTDGISILFGNGNGTFRSAKSFFAKDGFTTNMIVADFNNDQIIDLATTSMVSDSLLVFLGTGNGSFRSAIKTKLSFSMSSVCVSDFDGDGVNDIAEVSFSNTYIYKGKGDGTFDYKNKTLNVYGSDHTITTTDYNDDGKVDLVISSRSGGLTFMFGNGDCTFTPPQTWEDDAMSIVIADFDGDNKPDFGFIYGLFFNTLQNNIWVFLTGNLPKVELGSDESICPKSTKILDAGSGYSYLWNDGSTNQTLQVTKSGMYAVTITDISSTCKSSDSIRITIKTPYIESNAVATVLQNNRIVFAWERTSNKNTASYKVLRESNIANDFKEIGTKSFNQDSYVVDSTVDASQQEYRYKLRTINECGDSVESPIHKTILLQVTYSTSLRANILTWYGYLGIPLSTYHVFRNGVEINSVAASATNNTYPMNDFKGWSGDKYYISYDLPDSIYTTKTKMDSGPFSLSLSNMAESELTVNHEQRLEEYLVSPNPAKYELNIVNTNNIKILSADVINAIGIEAFKIETINESSFRIDVSQFPSGIYQLVIKTENAIISKSVVISR